MKENKKVLATYSLNKENKEYIEKQAKLAERTISSYMNMLISQIRKDA
jgi:hypothetical protein